MGRYYAKEKIMIPSTGRDIKVLIFRPVRNRKTKEKTHGVLWLHGGGYITGMAEMFYMTRAKNLVKKFGAVVVMPDYRLAGEAPYPAALEDCYAALRYLKDRADELGVNSSQLMVGGESAGGGLTAALCMLARDRGEVSIAFQMPLYPMLDDRDTESSRDNHAPVWNTKRNHAAWKKYLGGVEGQNIPAYAAPARQTDHRDLPPAYTFVGNIEPFYCETLTFVENLRKAGIPAELDIYPQWFHAYDLFFPFTKKGKLAIHNFERHYQYAALHYFAEQPEKEKAE